MKFDDIASPSQLLKLSPDEIQIWLSAAWNGTLNVPEDFNWLGLAEVAGGYARQENMEEHLQSDMSWAEIAISVYEWLAERGASDFKFSAFLSGLHVRAFMIRKWGHIAGHSVLDLNHLVKLFFDALPITFDTAKQKSILWTVSDKIEGDEKADVEDLRNLRRVKNLLGVIKPLTDSGVLISTPELNEWLSLQPQLP